VRSEVGYVHTPRDYTPNDGILVREVPSKKTKVERREQTRVKKLA